MKRGDGHTQQEEQVWSASRDSYRGADEASSDGESERRGEDNRAVETVQIKADDTVSALKARQLGTLTWDSHPARRLKTDSPCVDPLCDTSMLVDGPLPYPC